MPVLVKCGGGGLPFAVITVTYPSGSVCTCSDGARTLQARDTSGSFSFCIPYAGTWTASCTNGTYTDTKTVAISARYQSEYVALAYMPYLYNLGDQCSALTGGWSNSGFYYKSYLSKAPTFGASSMTVAVPVVSASTDNSYCAAGTQSPIDLSSISKLVVTVTQCQTGVELMVASAKGNLGSTRLASVWATGTGDYEVDVSSISSGYVVLFTAGGSGTSALSGTVTKIWGE